MGYKMLKVRYIIIFSILSILFLLLSYIFIYSFIPCVVCTFIDLLIIRNKIDKDIEKKKSDDLIKTFRICMCILVVSLVVLILLLVCVFSNITLVWKIVSNAVAMMLLVVDILLVYTISTIQLRVIQEYNN